MPNINVLVVEDEEAIREMLVIALEQADFCVSSAGNTQRALALMNTHLPDLIVLDWMLPGMSGVDWAKRLRNDKEYQRIPFIMVTARKEEQDKVLALEIGADDFVTKPFSPRELIARIHAVLRRTKKPSKLTRIEVGCIVLDNDEHRVSVEGKELRLSPTEYLLLEFFLTHPSKVYTRTQLLDQVWGDNSFVEERTIDVHIRRLRKSLDEHGQSNLIQTVRGFGYRLSGYT